MTVYYFEGSPIVAPLTIESNEPIFVADTISLKQQRASQGAQRWELSFQIQTKDVEEDYFVAIITNNTSAGSMTMPQLVSITKKVELPTTAGISAATAAGANSVLVNFGSVGFLPKGSFIKFSNHGKIYMVTENVNTTASQVSVGIYPSLRSAVSSLTNVYHPNSSIPPTLQYFRDLDTLQGIIYEDGVIANPGTIRIIEAL